MKPPWLAAVLVLASACVATPRPEPTLAPPSPVLAPTAQPTPTAEPPLALPPAPIVLVKPAASPSAIAQPLSVLVGRGGSDLRVGLDLALQEQALLTAVVVSSARAKRRDQLAGAARSLDQSSAGVAAIVGAVEGLGVQQQLLDKLRAQTAALVDGRDVQSLNQPGPGPVPATLFSHRADGSSQDEVAGPLAASLAAHAPQQVAGATDGADVDLRLALDLRLQQRIYLLGNVFAGQSAGPGELSGNAEALAQQVAADYGDQLATTFAGVFGDRNTQLLRLASAEAPREAIQNGLEQARDELDAQLARANPLLPRGIVASQLRAEDQELVLAVDSFAARDWGAGYSHLHQAARLSQRFGDGLAEATVNRFPGRFLAPPTPTPQDEGFAATMT